MNARPSPYAAHRGFIAPAMATPGLRPVILGFIIIEALYGTGQRLFLHTLDWLNPDLADTVMAGDTARGLLIGLASFLILALALAFVLARVHGRGLASLIGPPGAPVLRQAWRSFALIGFTILLWQAATIGFDPGPGAYLRPLPQWLATLPLALLALLIQTGSEELYYRGYLQQQIAAVLPSPLAWLVLPNIAFALAHVSIFDVPPGDNAAYAIWAFCFGLVASDLTARAGNLGPALAMHMANNIYAFLFYAEESTPDSGLALVLFPNPAMPLPPAPGLTWSLLVELAFLALVWLAGRLALRR